MEKQKQLSLQRLDKPLAIVFAILSILFIVMASASTGFFDWVFARHQNQLSWYIRPLFLIPFCFFSFKRSFAGISITIFLLLTSMSWFPVPATVNNSVADFLAMEKDYLLGDWGWVKIVTTILVPLSLIALSIAFWKRSLWMGISVMVFIAVAKMLWSVLFGGESGRSVILPAVIGLLICIALISVGFIRMQKKNAKDKELGEGKK